MKFGPVPVQDALGAIAAHAVRVGDVSISKGAAITAEDIAALDAAGVAQITVAQLGKDDLHEDAAATALANALVPDPSAVNLRLTKAATGRVNVYAEAEGIVQLVPAAIAAFNAVDPMITVATVPAHHRLAKGGMVATIKVISYAVPQAHVDGACATDARLALATGQVGTVTLIETTTDGTDPAPKGRAALEGRVAPLGAALTERIVVPHDVAALAQAIQDAPGDMICILTASATSDSHDVAPSALRHAGGRVLRFGMPVDPGNLLFIADLRSKPVIGLPGCARSPALNGADWVLNRILCGVPVTSADIAAMGVGGLLKEIPTRPRPRAG
jgi:molybdenum cofactor cytidylyltransferase